MSAHWEKADPEDYQPRSYEYRDLTWLVDEIARAGGRDRRKRLREAIDQRPPEEVIPLLALELSECTDAKRFDRVARTLARVGGPEAMDVLARHARTQRRFPGLAIHALSECADERVIPLLTDLAEFGKYQQRVSSIKALGRMQEVRSVETLCRIAANRQDSVQHFAMMALFRKGGYHRLAEAVLAQPDFDAPTRVRYLLAMELPKTTWPRFHAERLLNRITLNQKHRLHAPARETLDHLKAQETLLRASGAQEDGVLLRASSGSPGRNSDLLRPSEGSLRLDRKQSVLAERLQGVVLAVKRALHLA